MNLKLLVAVLAIAALPVCAQAQKPAAMKATKADAQKVVNIISADKVKAQAYCELASLGEQVEQADKSNDPKKADELSKKMDDLTNKLGPEYAGLMDALQDMDPETKEGQEIGTTLEALDKLCAK